jgi:hypothetical protein
VSLYDWLQLFFLPSYIDKPHPPAALRSFLTCHYALCSCIPLSASVVEVFTSLWFRSLHCLRVGGVLLREHDAQPTQYDRTGTPPSVVV